MLKIKTNTVNTPSHIFFKMYKGNEKISFNCKELASKETSELKELTASIEYQTMDKIILFNDNSQQIDVLCNLIKKEVLCIVSI